MGIPSFPRETARSDDDYDDGGDATVVRPIIK